MVDKFYRIRDNNEDLTGFSAADDDAARQHVHEFLKNDHTARGWDPATAELVEWTNVADGEGATQEYRRVAAISELV